MADEEQVTLEKGELSLDSAVESGDHEGHSQNDDVDVSDKRVRDAQSKMHEEAQKRADLERQVEKMTGQLSVLTELVGRNGQPQAQPVQEENPFQFLDDDKFKESLLDSGDAVATAMKRVVAEFGKTLSLRDRMLIQELNTRDPEIRSATEQIKAFRNENPEFNDFTDQQIIKVIKKNSPQSEEPKKKVLSIGSRPVANQSEDDDLQRNINMWYNKIGYNVYEELDKKRRKK